MESLPVEILQEIFLVSDPYSLGPAAGASTTWAGTLRKSMFIWRDHFLRLFDDPMPARALRLLFDEPELYDWRIELQRRLRARTLLEDVLLLKRKPEERCEFWRCLIDVAETALPGRDAESKNIPWLRRMYDKDICIHSGSLWDPSFEEQQLRSKIHIFLGCTNLDLVAEKRLISRHFVYNLCNYNVANFYGPYIPDKSQKRSAYDADTGGVDRNAYRVDWVNLQHLHHVFAMDYLERVDPNLEDYRPSSTSEDHAKRPLTINQIRADTAPPNRSDLGYSHTEDWAGVEGRWRCSFAFCDHRDLLKYNAHLQNIPEEPGLESEDPFIRDDFTEALRAIRVEFRVTTLATASPTDPYPQRPPIHFHGRLVFSLGEDEFLGEPMIIGTVSMTADGEIRWQFTSGENQRSMWSSEGIQIGGVRSAYGVMGIWTTVFHDETDPVGPFWLLKEAGRSIDKSG